MLNPYHHSALLLPSRGYHKKQAIFLLILQHCPRLGDDVRQLLDILLTQGYAPRLFAVPAQIVQCLLSDGHQIGADLDRSRPLSQRPDDLYRQHAHIKGIEIVRPVRIGGTGSGPQSRQSWRSACRVVGTSARVFVMLWLAISRNRAPYSGPSQTAPQAGYLARRWP